MNRIEQQAMLLTDFKKYLESEHKSPHTIRGYLLNIQLYRKWFKTSFGKPPEKLYRENILEFRSYLIQVVQQNARTINHKLSSLRKYNEFLIEQGVQKDMAVLQKDMMKIQQSYASPTTITEQDVKAFMQEVLEHETKRDYALVVLMAYTGVRISEALDVKLSDFNLQSGECIIRSGKGAKQRIVPLNNRVVEVLGEYLKFRDNYKKASISDFLFVSKDSIRLNRTVVNDMFNRHSDTITPHQLRHFFCTNALEKGLGIHEVANIAGHTNIHTTMIYTNPDRNKLKQKMDLL
ncbi:MAG: tyrosine-type recombinase/integrase [Candidatus Dojkabacteria bacterium]